MSLLSKLTLIIPTYNRQDYALRNMRYWSGSEATVHILDGSEKTIEHERLKDIEDNIYYHHFPVSVFARLEKVHELVKTKYVALLADDEFYVPSATEMSIAELESDPELVACHGQAIGKLLSESLIVHSSNVDNYTLGCRKGKHDLTQDDPFERMITHMDNYAPSAVYAVCRSNVWLPAIALACKRVFSCIHALELQFELSISFLGKTRAINELFLLRSAENPPNEKENTLHFHSWYMNPDFSEEVEDFLNITANALASVSEYDPKVIRKGLIMACKAYVEYCEKQFRENFQLQPSDRAIRKLLSQAVSQSKKMLIKKTISKLPNNILRGFPNKFSFCPYIKIAEGIESVGVHVDWDQLSAILKIVREFHNARN